MFSGLTPLFSFSFFGKTRKIDQLNYALREAGIHPALVPDSVLYTIVKLLRNSQYNTTGGDLHSIATLIAYIMLSKRAQIYIDNPKEASSIEYRIENALNKENNFDSQIILLAFHANLIHPEVINEFNISISKLD
tara:strand:+ start:8132 stop:8536 length:405 start_codon:yes stop_codon:yes gene_type:complete